MTAKASTNNEGNEDQPSNVEALREVLRDLIAGGKTPDQRAEEDAKKSATLARTTGVAWDDERKIRLPRGLTYNGAISVLQRKEKEAAQMVIVQHKFDVYPLDGARALRKAIEEMYGIQEMRSSWFSNPAMLAVEVGYEKFEQVPWGDFTLPGVKGSFSMDSNFTPNPQFIFQGEIQRAMTQAIQELADLVRFYLRTDSIYRGKAVRLKLDYTRPGFDMRRFNPEVYQPRFIRLSDHHKGELIVGEPTGGELERYIFNRVENRELGERVGLPFRHGVLLEGNFGTGKSLTALEIALRAIENDISFFLLEDVQDLTAALKFVSMYTPAVLFGEDLDKLMSEEDIEGERPSPAVQQLSLALDGTDTKDHAILTVLTTNRAANIFPGLLRAGRMDTVIHYESPDAETAARFVAKFGGKLLHKSALTDEGKKLYSERMVGFAPAFIREAINKAKWSALYREKTDNLTGKITAEDLASAAAEMEAHIALASAKKPNEQSVAEAYLDEVASRVWEKRD